MCLSMNEQRTFSFKNLMNKNAQSIQKRVQQISMNCKIYFPMKNVCTKIAITIFAGNYCTNDLTVSDVLSDTKEICEYSV